MSETQMGWRLRAQEIRQGGGRAVYSFGIDGKRLPEIAGISRVHRDAGGEIEGYQRPEILTHVNDIQDYLESPAPLFPNAITVAFDTRAIFEPLDQEDSGPVRWGTLIVPVEPEQPEWERPGWVVDGQQRLAAIRAADVREFHIFVTAFIAEDEAEQREQFILINTTKPLPQGLIDELLPSTDTALPLRFEKRRLPSYLVDRLNRDEDSPFRGLVKMQTNPRGVIKANSLLRMVDNSLGEGLLRRFRDRGTRQFDGEGMLRALKEYWTAVAQTFPAAWGQPPRASRLMHGAGIVSMGMLMDSIWHRTRPVVPGVELFRAHIAHVSDFCHWTAGLWDFGEQGTRQWNDIENTPKDVQMLSEQLRIRYNASAPVQAATRRRRAAE